MTTRVGWWYATGPADEEYYPGHLAFNLHTVVSDESSIPGCVTVVALYLNLGLTLPYFQ
jgi:hypothetical protein